MKKLILVLTLIVGSKVAKCQIIDMHMHCYTEKDFWTGKARNGLEASKWVEANPLFIR